MRPGSVIVDLAAEAGGNCELTEPGQTVVREGVTIVSPLNLPATMPEHASALYARNVQSFLQLVTEDGELKLDFDDEIVSGACVVRGGEVRDLMDIVTELAILVLAGFLGFLVISKVPNTLHTPLMSGTNAIHGIVLLGGLVLIGEATGDADQGPARHRDRVRDDQRRRRLPGHRPHARDVQRQKRAGGRGRLMDSDVINLLYIVAFSLFILGLAQLTAPTTRGARQPDRRGRHGRRGDRDAAARGHRQLGPHRAGHRDRHGHRGSRPRAT